MEIPNENYPVSYSLDTTHFGPTNLVILQPTSYCNLDCDYCYLPDRHLKNTLSLELIDPIFKAIFESPFTEIDFTICWHAGEPLAAGLEFYRQAFAFIDQASDRYNYKKLNFCHSFQTNAILINQDWCDFFKTYPVHIGVSLDGPAFLHDAHRKTRTGLGSHQATMRGVEYLQKNELFHNIITVLTEDSLDYADAMFNFFRDQGLTDVGFNMEETEGVNRQSSLEKSNALARYRAFIQRFWQLTSQSDLPFRVREFECLCSLIYTEERLDHTDMNHPFAIVNIDHQGNFSTFDPELLSVNIEPYGHFILGNVLTDSFASVCESPKFQRIYADMQAGVAQCRQTCDYFGLCGGGAGSNKYWENGSFNSTETLACRYRIQEIAEVVIGALEESLGVA
ncbi:cyclophane-forming radical SAM/SPASM peptide maturase GrrM/OscB [Synechocystis sp. LKSZ1]|uniref:cyclophane-forming radical SAM/SPASM peptide maturase GrrM/OscB n=1 Tax=Synechocystis sp. LKSZ1 TaxID=3144951 RepID=UPI00336C0CA9